MLAVVLLAAGRADVGGSGSGLRRTASSVVGVEPHGDRRRACRTRRVSRRSRLPGTAQIFPPPTRPSTMAHARAYFFGPAASPAGRAGASYDGANGVRGRQNDPTRSTTFGSWFRRGFPTDPDRRSGGSGRPTGDAEPGRHALELHPAR